MNADHSSAVKRSAGPSGSLESLTATPLLIIATSTHSPTTLWLLLRHCTPESRVAGVNALLPLPEMIERSAPYCVDQRCGLEGVEAECLCTIERPPVGGDIVRVVDPVVSSCVFEVDDR